MAQIIDTFGGIVEGQLSRHPERARRLLLAAYRAYGFKMKRFPNPRLSPAKNYLGTVSMRCMIQPLAHPEKQVLTSIFTPCEVFHAMGLYPMCAEQYATYINGAGAERAFVEAAEQAGVSETFCSYHKVVIGGALSGVMPKPAAVVNTSLACDANNLTFRKAAERLGAEQYYIDVPYTPSEEAVDYVAEQLKEMSEWLGDMTHASLNEDALQAVTERSKDTMEALWRAIPLRNAAYVPTELTTELYEALMVHNALGLEATLKYAKMLLQELESSTTAPGRKILWLHSNPYYQEAAKRIFNYVKDPWIALTEMCYDPLIDLEDTDPWRFMARRAVYNSYNGPVERRAEKAVQMARTIGADGAILFCHWGCKETCGASGMLRDALEAAGYPTLILNGDGVDRRNASDGQTSTRIEAFLEMIDGKSAEG